MSPRIRDGYLEIGRFGSAPVRVHWSAPVAAFVLAGFAFAPGAWLGFVLLILAHELGHAALARYYGCHVISIDAHALGGTCMFHGHVTGRQSSIIAWGGVLAQLAILVTSPLWSRLLPSWHVFAQLTYTLTATNLILMVLNLIPVRPFDGAEAWQLLRR